MSGNKNPIHDLARSLTKAIDRYAKRHPGVDAMQVCAALGAAGAAAVSISIPPGNQKADLIALGLMGHGYSECLDVLRRAQAN